MEKKSTHGCHLNILDWFTWIKWFYNGTLFGLRLFDIRSIILPFPKIMVEQVSIISQWKYLTIIMHTFFETSFYTFKNETSDKVCITLDSFIYWLRVSRMKVSRIFCKYCSYQLNTIRILNYYSFNYTNESIGFQYEWKLEVQFIAGLNVCDGSQRF